MTDLNTNAAAPVPGSERLASLDVLRGVAILGILVMNIYAFAMPLPAYNNPLIMGGTEAINIGTWFVTHILFDQKFMSIFSMLFGAGMILMMDRAESRGAAFGPIYYRRTFWLLLLGMLHGYLVWFGDILFHYALMGMIVYPFRKASPGILIAVACAILPITLLINFASSFYIEDLQSQAVEIQRIDPPIDVTQLPGPAQKIVSDGAPPKLQMMAAKGIVPGIMPADLLTVLVLLSQ